MTISEIVAARRESNPGPLILQYDININSIGKYGLSRPRFGVCVCVCGGGGGGGRSIEGNKG